MAMYAINKQGLRERPSYDELIGYLQYGQEKISYPNRFAKQLRNTPQLSNLLDGEGFSINDINEQQINHAKEIAKQLAIIQAGGDAKLSRVASHEPSNAGDGGIADDLDNQLQDQAEQISEVINDHNANQQNQSQSTLQQSFNNLNIVHQQSQKALHGGASLINKPSAPGSLSDPIPNTTQNPQEPKGKGRPQGSKAQVFPPLVPPQPVPPPAKTTTQANPKSLNLLHKANVEPKNIPVGRGIIEETTTSSGSSGNRASSSSGGSTQTQIPDNIKERIRELKQLDKQDLLTRAIADIRARGGDPRGINANTSIPRLIELIVQPQFASASAPEQLNLTQAIKDFLTELGRRHAKAKPKAK